MSEDNINAVATTEAQSVSQHESIRPLVNEIRLLKIKLLEEEMTNEYKTLKERQAQVSELHKLMKALNKETSDKGELDITENSDIQNMITTAIEYGVDIDSSKMTYNSQERERLVENVRMTIDDLGVQNEMQLQKISSLYQDRNEVFQLARSIEKSLHEAERSPIRGIRGG